MAKATRFQPSPATENRTVPIRRPNAALRTREHRTPAEVDALVKAAKANRWGERDGLMILMAYRHGLRTGGLEWSQVDFTHAVRHLRRAKRGTPATHPLQGNTLRALRRLRRDAPQATFVFLSERGAPFSPAGFATMVERAGQPAGLPFKAHPHMLRHTCGFKLAKMAGTRGPCKPTSGITTSSTRCGTQSWRPDGSRILAVGSSANLPASPGVPLGCWGR